MTSATLLELLRLPRNDLQAALGWYRRAAGHYDEVALGQACESLLRLQDDPAELIAVLAAERPWLAPVAAGP